MKYCALPEAQSVSTCRRAAVSRVSVATAVVVAAARRDASSRLYPTLSSPLPGLLQGAATLGAVASLLIAPPAVHAKTVSGLTSDVIVVGAHTCIFPCPCKCPCHASLPLHSPNVMRRLPLQLPMRYLPPMQYDGTGTIAQEKQTPAMHLPPIRLLAMHLAV